MDIKKRGFVLIFLNLFVEGALGVVTSRPENIAVLSGARVTFNCAVTFGPPTANWAVIKVNNSTLDPISSGTFVYPNYISLVELNQSNLIIKNASSLSAGSYICSESNSDLKASGHLIVIDSNPLSMANIRAGDLHALQTVEMSCSVTYAAISTYVNASIKWSSGNTIIDGSPLAYTTSGILTTANSTISVQVGYVSPFPVYQCQVTFNVSTKSPDATNTPSYNYTVPPSYPQNINVIYIKPNCSISGASNFDSVYEGTTLTCVAEANPPVNQFRWTDRNYENSTAGSTFQVWHSGEYMCTGNNIAGECMIVINITTSITTTASTTTAITITRPTSQSGATGVPTGDKPVPDTSAQDGSGQRNNIIIGVVVGVGGFILLLIIIIVICCCIKKKKSGRYGEDRNMKSMADYPPPPYPAHAGPQRNSNPDVVDFQTPYANVVDDGLNYAQIQLDNQPRSRQPLKMPTESNYTDVRLA